MDEMQLLGQQLLIQTLPSYIQGDLSPGRFFLEIGMDEALVGYPWELMHDGEDFLCLKHYLGRFVNSTSSAPLVAYDTGRWSKPLQSLSVLIIAVPNPMPRGGINYEPLDQARKEADAIVKILTDHPDINVSVLRDVDATYNKVFQALSTPTYQIVHFCGHANFDDKKPPNSSIVLQDRSMATGSLSRYISMTRPILCFVNACESAMTRESFNVFGLARAFLDTGAYLLGSRWKVDDHAATVFATKFYTSLLDEENPLGKAVYDARIACQKIAPDDFAWASYVLYGDPRVCFRKVQAPTGAASSP